MSVFGDDYYETELKWREKLLSDAKVARLTAEAEAQMAAASAEAAMRRAAFYRGEEALHREKLLAHIKMGWERSPEHMRSRLSEGEQK